MRTGQQLMWTHQAAGFIRSVEWTGAEDGARQPRLLRPSDDLQEVAIDPLRGFGEPVVRNVRTEIIAELFRAGEPPEAIAEMYELPRLTVDQALRYEMRRANGSAEFAA